MHFHLEDNITLLQQYVRMKNTFSLMHHKRIYESYNLDLVRYTPFHSVLIVLFAPGIMIEEAVLSIIHLIMLLIGLLNKQFIKI
jgi:hypothetical protein